MDSGFQPDIVVVGSGPSGAQCAQTLVNEGLNVLMIDAGNFDNRYEKLIPSGQNFMELRREDTEQHKYLLGEEYEGIPLGKVKVGAQLTPARKYVLRDVADWLPTESSTFSAMETLARGGLGGAWGAGCCVYSSEETQRVGMDVPKMNIAYQVILDRIGVSMPGEDISKYVLGKTANQFDKLVPDQNHKSLLEKYQKKKKRLNDRGVYMGETALAILTKDHLGRSKKTYNELGFYSDREKSVYRPWITIDELEKKRNFHYQGNTIVGSFEEVTEGVQLKSWNLKSREKQEMVVPRVVFCTGPLGSSRIVLRSLANSDQALPLLCNAYSYLTCIQPRRLGAAPDPHRTSFSQLSLFFDPNQNNDNSSMASLYSYRSLMLYRTLLETPLNTRDARIIMQYLTPAITIAGIHHPDKGNGNRTVALKRDETSASGDKLNIDFSFTDEELADFKFRDGKIGASLRSLGCYPLKKISPGNGASIHYAGTLPFSKTEKAFHLSPSGKLHGTKNVYFGDGSGFKFLPAKGLTFSLMANAHVVAQNVIKEIHGT